MWRFPGLAMALLPCLAASTVSALSVDQSLLSLVPPGSKIVAGMDAPVPKGQSGSFILTTHKNTVDLQDFFALTGVDSSRVVRHAMFVATEDNNGQFDEHSFLASGHFDQARIYKSAVNGGAKAISYHNIPVLEIEPFARERGDFNDLRWLAILNSDILLFGTVPHVRQELDRYQAHSAPDPSLQHRMARMRGDNETWCVMLAPARNAEIRSTLTSLDAKLGEVAANLNAFQFGIRYRKHVEFEYEITTASNNISASLTESLNALRKSSSFLPNEQTTERENTTRGVIKIPQERFSKWLEEITTSERGLISTSP